MEEDEEVPQRHKRQKKKIEEVNGPYSFKKGLGDNKRLKETLDTIAVEECVPFAASVEKAEERHTINKLYKKTLPPGLALPVAEGAENLT